MSMTIRIAIAAAALAATPVLAAGDGACSGDPAATGLGARVRNMEDKIERVRMATDAQEQRHLMELHGKLMREGLQALRQRNPGMACRIEITDALMDQMIQHQQLERETGGR